MIKRALVLFLLCGTFISAEEIKYEPMDYKAFNESLRKEMNVASVMSNDPVIVALKFIGPHQGREQTIVRRNESAEAADSTEINITTEGLLDDSVRGVKYKIILKKTNNLWSVQSAGKSVKCWPGRGHTNYSSKPCN